MANRIGARRKRNSAESSSQIDDFESASKGVERGESKSLDIVSHSRARAEWRNDERISALIAMLELGIPTVAACAKLAIPRRSLYDAMETDADLRQRVEDARATWEADYVQRIATNPDWKAQAWILERRIPKRWSPPKNRSEISGPDGAPVQLAAVDAVDRMSDAELTAAAKTLLGGGE